MCVVCITTSKLLFMWFGPGWCCVSSAGALECHSIALTALMLHETTGSYKIFLHYARDCMLCRSDFLLFSHIKHLFDL